MSEKESVFRRMKRAFSYYYTKAIREKGTPEYIGRGWAIGVFVGFAVPIGLQLVVSLPLAFLMKGSKIGAVVGTFTTNHFTIFLIYPFQCWLGNLLLGGNLTIDEITRALEGVFRNKDYQSLFELGMETLLSFLIGGLLLAVIFTPISYYAVKFTVIRYRKEREKALKKKEELRQRKQLEQHHENAGNH